jgi:MFS transporter, DHA1 family, inner membrane transport protein
MSPKRRAFLLLCLAHVTISFNLAAIAAAIPSISRELGFPDVEVARIIPHYLWAYGLGALIYAPLTRRFSIKSLLIASLTVFSLTSFYCGITRSLDVLLIANFVNGLAAASVVPLGLMTIGKLFEKHERGRAVGLFFSLSFVSSLLGVIASGIKHWSFLFIIPFILGIITIINILYIQVKELDRPDGRHIDYVRTLRHKDIQKVFVLIFLMSFLYHGVHKWYGVFLGQEYHLNQFAISSLILVTSISGAVGQVFGGALTDLKSRYFTITLGLGVLGMASCFLFGHYPVVVVGFILAMISAGWTIGHNGISTVLTDFPDEHRSELAGLNSSIRFLSGGLGFYLSGYLVVHGFGLNFLVIGLAFLALLPFIRTFLSGHLQLERK